MCALQPCPYIVIICHYVIKNNSATPHYTQSNFIVLQAGRVVEVDEPEVEWCPIFAKLRGIQKITSEDFRKNMEFRSAISGCLLKNASWSSRTL
nr:DUF2099 family protein [Methanosarcina siciliae]